MDRIINTTIEIYVLFKRYKILKFSNSSDMK